MNMKKPKEKRKIHSVHLTFCPSLKNKSNADGYYFVRSWTVSSVTCNTWSPKKTI